MKTIGNLILGLIATFLVLFLLRWFGVIEWSYLWITSLIWVPVSAYIIFIVGCIVVASIRNIRLAKK